MTGNHRHHEAPDSSGTGGQEAVPSGKIAQVLWGFKQAMALLKGGGVWAALTLSLLVNGWQAVQNANLDKIIIEILMAAKAVESAPPLVRTGPPVITYDTKPTPTPVAIDNPQDHKIEPPRHILNRYQAIYQQRMARE